MSLRGASATKQSELPEIASLRSPLQMKAFHTPLVGCSPEIRGEGYKAPGGLSLHLIAPEPNSNRAAGNKSAPRGWILARVLAEHDEAVTVGRIAAREGSFSPHRHLPWTRCPPKLLNAIGVEDGAVAPRSVISTT